MPQPAHNHLRMHRKRWALTQDELALLLGFAGQCTISHYEICNAIPCTLVMIMSELLFGAKARDIFPAAYRDAEVRLLRRAKILLVRLEGRTDPRAESKRQLLQALIRRRERETTKP